MPSLRTACEGARTAASAVGRALGETPFCTPMALCQGPRRAPRAPAPPPPEPAPVVRGPFPEWPEQFAEGDPREMHLYAMRELWNCTAPMWRDAEVVLGEAVAYQRAGIELLRVPEQAAPLPCWLTAVIAVAGHQGYEAVVAAVALLQPALPHALEVLQMRELLRAAQQPVVYVLSLPRSRVAVDAEPGTGLPYRFLPLLINHNREGDMPVVLFTANFETGNGHFAAARRACPNGRRLPYDTPDWSDRVALAVDRIAPAVLEDGREVRIAQGPYRILEVGPEGPVPEGYGECPICGEPAPRCCRRHYAHQVCLDAATWAEFGPVENRSNPARERGPGCVYCIAMHIPEEAADAEPEEEQGEVVGPGVVITGTYLPDFADSWQCLGPGGLDAYNVRPTYPGSCRCRYTSAGVCPHLATGVARGAPLYIYGWHNRHYMHLTIVGYEVWLLYPPDALPAVRGDAYFWVATHARGGRQTEALCPYPTLASASWAGQTLPIERRTLHLRSGQWTAQRVAGRYFSPLRVLREAMSVGTCLQIAGGLAGASAAMWASMGVIHLQRQLLTLAPGLVHFSSALLYHLQGGGLPHMLAMLLVAQAALRLPIVAVGYFLPESVPALVGFSLGGPVHLAVSAFRLTSRVRGLVYETGPVDPIDLLRAANPDALTAMQDGANRLNARNIFGTRLMPHALIGTLSRLGYPRITAEEARLFHAVRRPEDPDQLGALERRREDQLSLVGSAPAKCWSCTEAQRGGKNKGLCMDCKAKLPGPGAAPPDPRVDPIVKECLPYTGAVPLMAVEARYVPPPTVEQMEIWNKVRTNFDVRLHAAEIRRQNQVRRAVLVGFGLAGHWPGVPQRGAESMYNGLRTRTFRKVPKPAIHTAQVLAWIRDAVLDHVPAGSVPRMDQEEWFRLQDRELQMRMAWRELQEEGWTPQDVVCKPFIKSEFHYMGEARGAGVWHKRSFKPRPIYTLSDKTQAVVGPWTRPLMDFAHRHLGPWSTIEYCGCNTPQENQRVLDQIVYALRAGHKVYLNDFTCFETVQTSATMHVVRELYRRWWTDYDELREWCMTQWEAPRFQAAIGPYRFSGRLPQMMCSGRSDTAITNSLLNAIATAFAHVVAVTGVAPQDVIRLSPEQVRTALDGYKIYVVGDDSVVTCPGAGPGYEAAVEAAYTYIGFQAKLSEARGPSEVVFLGHRPYLVGTPVGPAWRWGPTLGRRLYKHHYALDIESDPRAWLKEVANMEKVVYPFVPILSAQAEVASRLFARAGFLKKGDLLAMEKAKRYQMQAGTDERGAWIIPETYAELAAVYGVAADEIRELHEQCAAVTSLPYLIASPVIDAMCAKDN